MYQEIKISSVGRILLYCETEELVLAAKVFFLSPVHSHPAISLLIPTKFPKQHGCSEVLSMAI